MKIRDGLVKKGCCFAIILLLTITSFASINTSAIIDEGAYEEEASQEPTQLDECCYLGEWSIRFFNPIIEKRYKPEVRYNISYPLVCNFTEIDGKVNLQFSMDIWVYSIAGLIIPFRWGGFHIAIWGNDTWLWNQYFPHYVKWSLYPGTSERYTFPPNPVVFETNGQNKTIQIFLEAYVFPLPFRYIYTPIDKIHKLDVEIIPIQI